MYFEEEIKLEDCSSSNSPSCFACLSSTRKISSLGEYCAIFSKFFDYECSPDLRPISLCWECTAVLRKVKLFKEKVDHAQTVLSYHYLSQDSSPKILSSLTTTVVEICALGASLLDEEIPSLPPNRHEETYIYDEKLNNIEIKEKKNIDIDQADDMFMLGWEDDDIDDNTNTEKNLDTCEPNVKSGNVKYKAKKCSKIRSDRAIANSFSQCVEKKPRKSAPITVKADQDSEIDDDNDLQKPELTEPNIKTKKRKVIEDSDPDFDEAKVETPSTRYNTSYQKPCLYQYFPNERKKIPILDTPVALDEVRGLMDKDKETEVWNKLQYKCEMCVESIKCASKSVHASKHKKTGTRPHSCEICTLSFHKESRRDDHAKKHTKLLQCSACSYKCHLKELMEKHVKGHKNRIQCLTCMSLFLSPAEFYKHYYICDYCKSPHKNKRELEWHIFRSHTIPACKKCNKTFKDYKKYKRHLSLIHVPSSKKENFYCVACDKHFEREKYFRMHVDKAMAHAAERPHKPKPKPPPVPCLACPKTFSRKYLMMDHYNLVHLKDYRYKCDQCGKCLTNRRKLKKHILFVHEGMKLPKNKVCPHCQRAFAQKAVLDNHIRTHTGERPYQCQHCDARFAQSTACKQHVKFVHLKERREKPNTEPGSSSSDPIEIQCYLNLICK